MGIDRQANLQKSSKILRQASVFADKSMNKVFSISIYAVTSILMAVLRE